MDSPRPLTFEHDLRPFIQEAVAKAEAIYPPNTNLLVEVEMTDEMVVKIVVMPDEHHLPVQNV